MNIAARRPRASPTGRWGEMLKPGALSWLRHWGCLTSRTRQDDGFLGTAKSITALPGSKGREETRQGASSGRRFSVCQHFTQAQGRNISRAACCLQPGDQAVYPGAPRHPHHMSPQTQNIPMSGFLCIHDEANENYLIKASKCHRTNNNSNHHLSAGIHRNRTTCS